MHVLASSITVEDPVGLAAHHRRRKPAKQVGAGFFPQDLAGDRKQRKTGVTSLADGIGETVTRRFYGFENGPVESAVGIRKMIHGTLQPALQDLFRVGEL